MRTDHLTKAAAQAASLSGSLADLALASPSSSADYAKPPHLDDDYLTLSTVHSAKGPEWDAVHVISVSDGSFPSDMALSSPEGLEEERRLFPRGGGGKNSAKLEIDRVEQPQRRRHLCPCIDGNRSVLDPDSLRGSKILFMLRRVGTAVLIFNSNATSVGRSRKRSAPHLPRGRAAFPPYRAVDDTPGQLSRQVDASRGARRETHAKPR